MIPNNIRLAWALLTARGHNRRPIIVHMNVTNACNLKCSYCYGKYSNRPGVKDLDSPTLIKIIRQLAKSGTRRINFGAGEPLIRNDIGTLINVAAEAGIVTSMNTNGHLVPKMIDKLKKLDTLCISLDGSKDVHDRFKGAGSHKMVMDAIRVANEAGMNVHTSTMLTKYNIDCIQEIVYLSVTKQFGTEWLLPFAQTNRTFLAKKHEYKDALNYLIDTKQHGYPVVTSLASLENARDWQWYEYRQSQVRLKLPCYAGRYMCIMDSDGKLYPCSQQVGTKFPALNVAEVGFEKAWNNLKRNRCRSCYAFMAFLDASQLIDWNLSTIIDYAKNQREAK